MARTTVGASLRRVNMPKERCSLVALIFTLALVGTLQSSSVEAFQSLLPQARSRCATIQPFRERSTVPVFLHKRRLITYRSSTEKYGRAAPRRNMNLMVSAGTLMAIAVVLSLSESGASTGSIPETAFSATLESVESIAEATMPLTTPDVLAVAVGECLGGLVAAASSTVFSMAWNSPGMKNGAVADEREITSRRPFMPTSADGNVAILRSALRPLLVEFGGLAGVAALVMPTLIASVSAHFAKLSARRQYLQTQKDAEPMQNLLMYDRGGSAAAFWRTNSIRWRNNVDEAEKREVDQPIISIDFVEAFSNVTKWLEYDYLSFEFVNPLGLSATTPWGSGLQGALWGSLACISSQLYADILYYLSGTSRAENIVRRDQRGRLMTYAHKVMYAAVFFGSYEAAQGPAQVLVETIASGALDSCWGSGDYGLCVETFVKQNPSDLSLSGALQDVWDSMQSLVGNPSH